MVENSSSTEGGVSFTAYLPLGYQDAIEKWGWERTEKEGETTYFRKGDRLVRLIVHDRSKPEFAIVEG